MTSTHKQKARFSRGKSETHHDKMGAPPQGISLLVVLILMQGMRVGRKHDFARNPDGSRPRAPDLQHIKLNKFIEDDKAFRRYAQLVLHSNAQNRTPGLGSGPRASDSPLLESVSATRSVKVRLWLPNCATASVFFRGPYFFIFFIIFFSPDVTVLLSN